MKHLYLIGGTMGVGKTTACQQLKSTLDRSVFLDGDWCWDMHPFAVTEETKAMVMDNISHLLTNFLRCSALDHIIFCWVMHEQRLLNDLLSRLPLDDCCVHTISLTCTAQALAARIQQDVDSGLRTPDVLSRSLARLAMYDELNTYKIDTTHLTVQETAQAIIRHTQKE